MSYKYGLKHYFKLLFVNINLQFKGMYEYKINFYSSIIKNSLSILLFLLFAKVFLNNFENVIDWNYLDFISFIYFSAFTIGVGLIFVEDQFLDKDILNGNLNSLLLKPGNRVLNYLLHLNDSSVIYIFTYTIWLLPMIVYNFTGSYFNLLLAFLISIFLGILFALFYNFLSSFNFYIIRLGSILINSLFYSSFLLLRTFPGTFFKGSRLRFAIALMPTYFTATLVIPLLQGKAIVNLFDQIILILILFLILTIGITVNWNYGLKRYEAFG